MTKRKPVDFEIDERECFIVTSHSQDDNGYPKFKIHGKTTRIYREVFKLCYGKIPKNKVVMHICDNRQCINPKHLKLGTHKQNMKDMKVKGRARNGSSGKLK